MRALLAAAVVVSFSANASAADPPPLAEKYLHSSKLNDGEDALAAVLQHHPKDDQARFGLGMVQFTNALQKFGQKLYTHGVQPNEVMGVPFVRIPVPENKNPTPISYPAFRKMFDDLYHDCGKAERTLAAVSDDKVKLPLHLGHVRFDFDGSGRGNDKFTDVLVKLMGGSPEFLKKDPSFLVCFDRGDVAWLRGYCHLLMAMIDGFLSVDLRDLYVTELHRQFAKAEDVTAEAKAKALNIKVIRFAAPERLGRLRQHMLMVCKLNHETWKHIRAETDDDREWLPHAKQKGVIGLPVTNELIDGWLAAVREVEDLLEGRVLIPAFFLPNADGKGLSLKKMLDEPPTDFDLDRLIAKGPREKYLERGKHTDFGAILRVSEMFRNTLSFAYAAWFN
jgi:hypothetical protein